jgi:hypothetical protein
VATSCSNHVTSKALMGMALSADLSREVAEGAGVDGA